MGRSPITYSSVIVKQQIEAWAEGLDFDPEDQVMMLLEDRFGANEVSIDDARCEADVVIITIRTDVWPELREFALLRSGSLAW